ncbi:MAG: hypothetical protein MJZ20_01110 [Bacteroidaceae bacterium]|nr:hypothetical protein [Bacteroidaceae bacterium]
MRLCNAIPARLLENNKHKQYNILNTSDLRGGGYCATGNPFNILTYNLFRYHTRAPDGCVVSYGQKSNDSKFHVENISSNNGFGGRDSAW